MAELEKVDGSNDRVGIQVRLKHFHIEGLFGTLTHHVEFPLPSAEIAEPTILIISGENGTGKTTIMSMISGMIQLNFDEFRKVPFSLAELLLTDGNLLRVERRDDAGFPLLVTFADKAAILAKERGSNEYTAAQEENVTKFREIAGAILRGVNFEFLGVDRSYSRNVTDEGDVHWVLDNQGRRIRRNVRPGPILSSRVQKFLQEAQLNHRRFFQSEDLDLLPRLLDRLGRDSSPSSRDGLSQRLRAITNNIPTLRRFGLQTDEPDLQSLEQILNTSDDLSVQSLAVIQTYVEIQERKDGAKDLIVKRLLEFEKIMDEFLFEKSVRIDPKRGLKIEGKQGPLSEDTLSSGEFHFLYMMVSALLCERFGSIIAIDEPELSLHVKWQRKLLSALARCASGASPLFFLATHSTAIAAEHADKVHHFSSIE